MLSHEAEMEALKFELNELKERVARNPIQQIADPTLEKAVGAIRRLAIIRKHGGHVEVVKAARYAASCLWAWADKVECTPGAANTIEMSLERFLSRAA